MGSLAVSTAISLWRGAPADAQKQTRSHACYAMTGRIAQEGDRVRVTIALRDVASAQQIWGECYEGRATKPFALQDRVTQGVMRAVAPNIMGRKSSAHGIRDQKTWTRMI